VNPKKTITPNLLKREITLSVLSEKNNVIRRWITTLPTARARRIAQIPYRLMLRNGEATESGKSQAQR